MRIIILGLRRSGTTVVWETLRQDARLRCLNEPFNPHLRDLPAELPNRSRREMIEILRRDVDAFWRRFAPIGRIEEIQDGFSDRQAAYLRFLADGADPLCFDTTRCHFKIAALAEILPDAVLVHLYRSPAAFASSHMIPTGSGGVGRPASRRRLARLRFFTRDGGFNTWGMEELMGRHADSLFGRRLAEIGLDAGRVVALPALGRLLALWRLGYETAEREGRRAFGDRFVTLPLESFCSDPRGAVNRIYERLASPPPELDLSRVHAAKGPHRAGDPRWRELYDAVGLPADGLPGRSAGAASGA